MTTLIFDSEISGHHLEYIHHLYDAAINDPQNQYIFILNKQLINIKDGLIWENSNNIKYVFLSNEEQKKCTNKNLLLASWHKSLIIRKYVRKFDARQIWLVMFMQLMPFLPLMVKNNVKITGVLYRIYIYEKEKMSKIRLILEFIRYKLITTNNSVQKILVLNDKLGAETLNKQFNTNKFKFIPDPIPFIDKSKLKDIRSDLGITKQDVLYLHFGGLNRRKGTLNIMQALNILSHEELKGKVFIFAGKIDNDIKQNFYSLRERNESKCKILVFDEFCSYEFINNLCFCCDCILIPYYNTNQSSGVLGYAGYFNKAVIAPSKGLLGHLVHEYNLGICLENIDYKSLSNSLLAPIPKVRTQYSQTHTVKSFISCWYS